MEKRGALIAFEGPDRSGKSEATFTTLKSLWDRDINAEWLCFPERHLKPEGPKIDQYLRGDLELTKTEAHLLFSKQRHDNQILLKSGIDANDAMIIDRYYHSGIAYSCAQGLGLEWCIKQELGLWKPDAVIYFDISPSEAAKRPRRGKDMFENEIFQAEVIKCYADLKDSTWFVVDASRDKQTVAADVLDIVLSTIRCVKESSAPLEILADYHFDEIRDECKVWVM